MSLSMTDRGSDQSFDPRRSRWIPWAIVGFFGIIIAVNAVMLWFALGTFNGLSYKEAYDRGIHYNDTLAEFEAQRALGWDVRLVTEKLGSRQIELTLTLKDDTGVPITSAGVEGALVRPVQEGNDFGVSLSHQGAGRYVAAVETPLAGQWDLDLVVVVGDDSYRLRERLMIAD